MSVLEEAERRAHDFIFANFCENLFVRKFFLNVKIQYDKINTRVGQIFFRLME